MPSGVSYVMTNRAAIAPVLPELFADHRIQPVARLPAAAAGRPARSRPRRASPTRRSSSSRPGVYNSAYFEHALLARQMGVELVEGRDLVCRAATRSACARPTARQPVDVIYRRIDDEFLDPVHFRADSVIGCPGVIDAARAGRVTIANAVGNGVADDKLIYTYVPDLIRYYLDEEPVLQNVDTYRLGRRRRRASRCWTGSTSWCSSRSTARAARASSSARGPTRPSSTSCAASCAPTRAAGSRSRSSSSRRARRSSAAGSAPRHVDLRPFAVNDGERVWVLPGGLTRVALPEGELVVNSSQGGGSKDTWVLAGDGLRRRARRARTSSSPRRPARRPAERRPGDGRPAPPRPSSSNSSARCRRGARRAVLSRIAESLFWIGRYVERADDTARILDVHTQLLLEDPWIDEDGDVPQPARPSWASTGARGDRWSTPRRCSTLLAYDRTSPSLDRRRARRRPGRTPDGRARPCSARDVGVRSTPRWRGVARGQSGNGAHALSTAGSASAPRWSSALADATMSRDEGWQFLVLGRTHRTRRHDLPAGGHARPRAGQGAPWTSTLRACGALRGVPAHLPGHWRPNAGPPSSCCSTGSSRGRWSSR